MKIGWIVWEYAEDERPRFYKDGEQPSYAWRSIRIAYAEVIDE